MKQIVRDFAEYLALYFGLYVLMWAMSCVFNGALFNPFNTGWGQFGAQAALFMTCLATYLTYTDREQGGK